MELAGVLVQAGPLPFSDFLLNTEGRVDSTLQSLLGSALGTWHPEKKKKSGWLELQHHTTKVRI